jgi:hypothetical protein
MTHLIVLETSDAGDAGEGYLVRIGPLRFVALKGPPAQTLGDPVEAVGAVLVTAEPRPRPFKLTLPVRGSAVEADSREGGYRLRRQLTQLIENPRWLGAGLYFHFAADPELDGWLRFGGADLTDDDPGIMLGEWDLELSDCYVVGKPGTHRLGRRLELVDRRSGLAPRDTRGLLYSTDHAAQALPTEPLILPGDVANVLLTRNRPPATQTTGPLLGVRRLWRSVAALDGDVASFLPDDTILTDPVRQYVDLEPVGGVRVWDTSRATTTFDPANWTPENTDTPELMGWERVFGPMRSSRDTPLAIDNGMCRLIWLGRDSASGLAIEYYDAATEKYLRLGRLAAASNVREATVVELTPERAVLEWRGAERALRAILQRGWHGPRLEGYNDAVAGEARIEYAPDAGAPVVTTATPTWVEQLTAGGKVLRWAKGADADARETTLELINGPGVGYYRAGKPVVAQIGTPVGPTAGVLASLAIADARSVPVLITR